MTTMLATGADARATNDAAPLIARLKAWLLPGGEAAARGVRGIRAAQRGRIRSGPQAKWNAFTAGEFVDATTSAFRWEARMGESLITSVHVTDAFEDGHGRLVVKKGPVPIVKLTGPDVDRGELQRYLAYLSYCPAMLTNNGFLLFDAIGPDTLRIRDRTADAGAFVELTVGADGEPAWARAVRSMQVGRRTVPTPWSARGCGWKDIDGLRVAQRMEAAWCPREGEFTYFETELTSFEIVR